MERIWSWVKSHPWYAAAIVFVTGLVIYFLFFRGSSSSAAAATPNPYDAYYAALANSTASGNSLAATQNATAAQTAQTQIAADASTKIAQIQADATTQQANFAANSNDYIAGLMAQLGAITTNAQLQSVFSNNQTALGIAQNTNQTALGIAQTQATAENTDVLTRLAGTLAALNPGANTGFGIFNSGGGPGTPGGGLSVNFSRSGGVGSPIDPAALAQLSPAARQSLGFSA